MNEGNREGFIKGQSTLDSLLVHIILEEMTLNFIVKLYTPFYPFVY